jgi:isocitrate lyase
MARLLTDCRRDISFFEFRSVAELVARIQRAISNEDSRSGDKKMMMTEEVN